MKAFNFSFIAQSRLWWLVLVIGILLVLGGFAYWFFPEAGYAIASQIFGWLLIAAGMTQLCVAAGPDHHKNWGWWIAGGVIDMFIGFVMVRSIMVSELFFPFFLAFIFIFWGIEALCKAAAGRDEKYWWLGIINGILLCFIGFLFMESGVVSNMEMVSFLTSIAFIYWGFTVAMSAYMMKPIEKE